MEHGPTALAVNKNGVVKARPDARRRSGVVAVPDDFVAEGFSAEYLVEYHLGVMAHMPVEMYIEGRRLGEEFMESKGGLMVGVHAMA
jgi:hypothetical protein